MADRVWLLEPQDFDGEVLAKAAGDAGVSLDRARSIVVKPNLCGGSVLEKDHLAVSNRSVVRAALVGLRREAPKAELYIGESDSTGNGLAREKFVRQDYAELIQGLDGCRLLDLSHGEMRKVPIQGRFFDREATLPAALVEADLVVSVAKMKTHTIATMTGATKNLFGCLPEGEKSRYHPHLTDVLLDLVSLMPRTIAVVEGCPGMEGAGPMFGTPVNTGAIVVGSSPLVVDLVAARLMGLEEGSVPVLRAARRSRALRLEGSEVAVLGAPLAKYQRIYSFITREQRWWVRVGLRIQSLGQHIENVGHFVHNIRSTRWALSRAWRRAMRWLGIGNAKPGGAQ